MFEVMVNKFRFLLVLSLAVALGHSSGQSKPKDESVRTIIIAGKGPAEHSLYGNEVFVTDLTRQFEKNGKTTVLNLDGPGSWTVNAFGIETKSQMDKSPPATRESVKQLETWVEQEKPKDLVLFVLGHGGNDGSSLQDSTLDKRDVDRFRKAAAGSFRFMRLNCNSGSGLAEINRKIPTRLSEATEYFEKQYPANSCGMALSREDEWAWDDQTISVARALIIKPDSGIDDLKKEAANRTDAFPTKTSDYFLRDLIKILCSDQKNFAHLLTTSIGGCNFNPIKPEATVAINCIDPWEKALEQINKKSNACQNLMNNMKYQKQNFPRELKPQYMKDKYPDLYARMQVLQSQWESIADDLVDYREDNERLSLEQTKAGAHKSIQVQNQLKKLKSDIEAGEKKIAQITASEDWVKYKSLYEALDKSPDYARYQKEHNPTSYDVGKDKDYIGQMRSFGLMDGIKESAKTCFGSHEATSLSFGNLEMSERRLSQRLLEAREQVFRDKHKIEASRTQAYSDLASALFLNRPELQKIGELYSRIRECERSPLSRPVNWSQNAHRETAK